MTRRFDISCAAIPETTISANATPNHGSQPAMVRRRSCDDNANTAGGALHATPASATKIRLYAQETRARSVIAGERAAKATRFVKTRAGDRVLDEASLARAQSLVGLKGYVTNIPTTVMAAGEVIGKYHDLWRVERSFRMSKSDLRARPMFHRTRDAIEAHLTIVFTALAVAHNVQERTGLAIANVIKQLRPLRSATIAINGATRPSRPKSQRHNEKSSLASASRNRGTKQKGLLHE
jgi:hypothetical protein